MASAFAGHADTGRFPRGLRRTTPPPCQSCWCSDCNCFAYSVTVAPLSSTAATSSCGCRLVGSYLAGQVRALATTVDV
jgi:hypothetical protein